MTREWIDFEKVIIRRGIPPLVVPVAQGKSVHPARVKPSYVKPKK